jgi:hypothetical protein
MKVKMWYCFIQVYFFDFRDVLNQHTFLKTFIKGMVDYLFPKCRILCIVIYFNQFRDILTISQPKFLCQQPLLDV